MLRPTRRPRCLPCRSPPVGTARRRTAAASCFSSNLPYPVPSRALDTESPAKARGEHPADNNRVLAERRAPRRQWPAPSPWCSSSLTNWRWVCAECGVGASAAFRDRGKAAWSGSAFRSVLMDGPVPARAFEPRTEVRHCPSTRLPLPSPAAAAACLATSVPPAFRHPRDSARCPPVREQRRGSLPVARSLAP